MSLECEICYQTFRDSSNFVSIDEKFQNKFIELIGIDVNKSEILKII